jgi:hypothetical protein
VHRSPRVRSLAVACVAKSERSERPIVAGTGYATIMKSMSRSHTRGTAATEIMIAIPSAVPITMKGMLATGKTATNAANPSKPRCTSGTAPTNTISKNWRIRLHSSQPFVPGAGRSSIWERRVSHNLAKNSHAGVAARRRYERYCSEQGDPSYRKTKLGSQTCPTLPLGI